MKRAEQVYLDYINDILFKWFMGDFAMTQVNITNGVDGSRKIVLDGWDLDFINKENQRRFNCPT